MHLYRTLSSSAVGSRAQCCSSCHCRISSSNCTTTGEIPLLSEQGHRLNTEPYTETNKHSRQDNRTRLLSSNKMIYKRATLRASSSSRYSCLLHSDSPDRQANEHQNREIVFTCIYYPRSRPSSSVPQTLLFQQHAAHRPYIYVLPIRIIKQEFHRPFMIGFVDAWEIHYGSWVHAVLGEVLDCDGQSL